MSHAHCFGVSTVKNQSQNERPLQWDLILTGLYIYHSPKKEDINLEYEISGFIQED